MWLQVECLTINTLVYGRLLQDILVALNGTVSDAHEEPDVEVHSQTHHGLDYSTMSACHLTQHIQNHPKGQFVAVLLGQGHASVLVGANMRFSSTEHSHVSEGKRHQTAIGDDS